VRIKLAFLLVVILLTSCTSGPGTGGLTATPAPTNTAEPTAGPTPTLPAPLVILVLPTDMNEQASKDYQTTVYDLTQAAGYRFQVLNKLTTDDLALEPNLKAVIALPPDPGIVTLAAAAPQAQFLAVNIPGVKPGGNISVLGGESLAIDKVAFMAGYIAAMLTEDYHTGVILRKGSTDAEKIRAAFHAGHMFYCGLCNPYAGPFEEYPLRAEIPEDAEPNEYSAYADLLIRKKVETIFLQPGMDTPELLQYLPTVGVLMIGTQSPTKNISGWIVTLQPNYLNAVKTAWPDLMAGKGGKAFPAPLSFTDVNADLFTPGKQQLAQQTLNDLLSGLISTDIKP
jgi:hypothetical protein